MSRKTLRLFSALFASVLLLAALSGCTQTAAPTAAPTVAPIAAPTQQQATPAPTPTMTPAPKEVVTLNSIYPGDEPKGLADVFTELNKRLAADISAKLELTWAPEDQYANKIEMSIAAGEKTDFIWSGSSDMSEFAAKKLIAPIDDPMAKYGQAIYANINNMLFDSMKIDGKLMGIPSTGNGPISYVYNVLMVRQDLRLKYNLPKLDTIDNMELFFKTIKDKEPTITPFCCSNAAYVIMRAFGPEGFLGGTKGSVAYRINDDGTVTCMPIQDAPAVKQSWAKAREWFNAGYIPADILNIGDTQAKMNAGATAATGGAALAASEQQAIITANVPDAVLEDQPVFGTTQKYLNGNGGNAMYLTSISKYPDQVVQFWSWILTNQDNFDLYCYGIKDVNYSIQNDRVVYKNDSYTSFPAWMFKNMNYLRFSEGVTDDYINTIKHWDDGAKMSPLFGFAFDGKDVSSELAQCSTVWGAYSPTLNTGAADVDATIKEFSAKIKAAGQDKIVAAAQKQVDAFLAAKK